MTLWQVDFSERPLTDTNGHSLWQLLICDPGGRVLYQAECDQNQARLKWLVEQFQTCLEQWGEPERVQFFRPQFQSLLAAAAQELNFLLEPTRQTFALKELLEAQAITYPTLPNYTGDLYQPTQILSLPPVPLPENLWGEGWQFTSLSAQDLESSLMKQPIPILSLRLDYLPSRLGLAPEARIPGVIFYGGRRSMGFARWLQEQSPTEVEFIPGSPDGLVMSAGLRERWVLVTFADAQVRESAQTFKTRQAQASGLHFILIQPDESGITYTGLWLLKK